MNPKVDFYFSKTNLPGLPTGQAGGKAGNWQKEIKKLRTIILDCHLAEELKWGCPCYTFEKNNIVLIHVFKEYCALLFFKGVLLKDTKGILIQQTENVQSARQVRFTNIQEVVKLEPILKAYIYEAVACIAL